MINNKSSKYRGYPVQPVPFTEVKVVDDFWSPRFQTHRKVTIPYVFQKCEEEGRVRNFARAGGLQEGEFEGHMRFDDSDLYKTIEGAAYSLQVHPDLDLEQSVDCIIDKIAAAQLPDGYLNTFYSLVVARDVDHPETWTFRGDRWKYVAHSHELYCAGHLMEAAVAYYQATGKRKLLDVTLAFADHIDSIFGPDKMVDTPGHQEVEIGLAKLYRVTGDEKYLNLATFFIDERGNSDRVKDYGPQDKHFKEPGKYAQDHIPFLKQDTAVGHSVRAGYFYAGAADVAALSNHMAYIAALDRIWENVVSKKIYITGGIGGRHEGESFGDDYELPNLTAYNETCAAIANIMWNHRMFMLHGDAKYIDVLEQTLYNGFLAGVSLGGDRFFYPNPLECDGVYGFNGGSMERKPWFNCSCCPSNVARFMPSIPGYIYAQKGNHVYVNLFISGVAELKVNGMAIRLSQQTRYPWEGKIILEIEPERRCQFTLMLRIPGWARGVPLPGHLYNYLEPGNQKMTLRINDQPVSGDMANGYVAIPREWVKGDRFEVTYPMQAGRVIAQQSIQDNIGKVALAKGPLVYCLESTDNPDSRAEWLIPDSARLDSEYRADMLSGIDVIRISKDGQGGDEADRLLAIPYYAWAHRGISKMSVWNRRVGN